MFARGRAGRLWEYVRPGATANVTRAENATCGDVRFGSKADLFSHLQNVRFRE